MWWTHLAHRPSAPEPARAAVIVVVDGVRRQRFCTASSYCAGRPLFRTQSITTTMPSAWAARMQHGMRGQQNFEANVQ